MNFPGLQHGPGLLMARPVSYEALAWAARQRTGSISTKAILFQLANMSDHAGRSWPSLKYIADVVECTRRTVIRAIDDLAANGFIYVENRSAPDGVNMSNVYLLAMTTPQPAEKSDSAQQPDPVQASEVGEDESSVPKFSYFWNLYPRKVGKSNAGKAWAKLKSTDRKAAIDDIRKRVSTDPQWLRDNGEFVPHPATYLNGERWTDEWKPTTTPGGMPHGTHLTGFEQHEAAREAGERFAAETGAVEHDVGF